MHLLRGRRRGGRDPELGQFTGKKRVLGEFRDEFDQLSTRYFCLFLAQSRERQQDLRKRSQVVATVGGDLDLLDACFLVAVDSNEAEEKLLWSWQTPDEVIRRAQAQLRISGVRGDHQQFLGILVSLADLFQAVEVTLVDEAGIVGLHTHAESHGEQGVRVIRVRLQPERLFVRGEEGRA